MKNTSDVELELVDSLPTRKRMEGAWIRRLEPLRKHPGIWARLRFTGPEAKTKTKPSTRAHDINARRVRLPDGIWKAATRGKDLYVCYCGEAPAK